MAICEGCGHLLESDDAFCPRCGRPVHEEPEQAPVPAARTPMDDLSPLRRSWMDFKASPHKFTIMLKLALFQFVPGVGGLILNGYAFTWAREQALGRHMPMPRKIVRPGVLDNGLYIYGVSLVAGLIAILAFLLGIAVVSALRLDALLFPVFIALVVCAAPFCQVMYMRTAICGRVRSGANLKRVWDLFVAPGKLGRAFSSCWIPMLISGLITAAIVFVVVMVFATALVPGLAALSAFHGYSYSVSNDALIAWQIFSTFITFLPLMLVACFAVFYISTAASVIIARAFGYWMRDFHPETWQEYVEHSKYYMDNAI